MTDGRVDCGQRTAQSHEHRSRGDRSEVASKDFKSLTEAPPSRLISEIGPTGRDFFGPGAHDAEYAEYMKPGVSHQRTVAVSVFY
jgi:hypothetical protein